MLTNPAPTCDRRPTGVCVLATLLLIALLLPTRPPAESQAEAGPVILTCARDQQHLVYRLNSTRSPVEAWGVVLGASRRVKLRGVTLDLQLCVPPNGTDSFGRAPVAWYGKAVAAVASLDTGLDFVNSAIKGFADVERYPETWLVFDSREHAMERLDERTFKTQVDMMVRFSWVPRNFARASRRARPRLTRA